MDVNIRNNRMLRIPLRVLNTVGFVQFEDQPLALVHRVWSYAVVVTYFLYNITQYVFLYINRADINSVVNSGGATTLYFTILAKGVCSLVYRDKYSEMYSGMHAKMKQIEDGNDEGMKEILNQHVKRCTSVAWILQILVLFTGFTFFCYLTALWILHKPGQEIHPFCADTWLPFATENHVLLTLFIYFYIDVLDCILMPQWNAMVIVMIIYATCMLRVLQYKLHNRDACILRARVKPHSGKITDEERYTFIVGCVEDHMAIIKFLEDLKSIISFAMAADFGNFVFILCGQALMASRIQTFGIEAAFSFGLFQSMLFEALLYYWHATETTIEGEKLASAIYESTWVDSNKAYRCALTLMIQRSNRPIVLQAGLFPMNLQTYIMILRTSYSVFTLLRQI